MNNIERFSADNMDELIVAMHLGLFEPGSFVTVKHGMPSERKPHRVVGRTLSEDDRGVMGFFYSIQDPQRRVIINDVAEYELEKYENE